MNLRQALVFAILMQHGDGVLAKHPDYMLEKLRVAQRLDEPEVLLDHFNMTIFEEYLQKWHVSREALSELR